MMGIIANFLQVTFMVLFVAAPFLVFIAATNRYVDDEITGQQMAAIVLATLIVWGTFVMSIFEVSS